MSVLLLLHDTRTLAYISMQAPLCYASDTDPLPSLVSLASYTSGRSPQTFERDGIGDMAGACVAFLCKQGAFTADFMLVSVEKQRPGAFASRARRLMALLR